MGRLAPPGTRARWAVPALTRPEASPPVPSAPYRSEFPWWVGLLVGMGVLASVGGALWSLDAHSQWSTSQRIQDGPVVAAAVVATGGPIRNHAQEVTVAFEDAQGSARRAEVRFPLGTASRVAIDSVTSVAYDPDDPNRAEVVGVPSAGRRDVARRAGVTLLVTGGWLALLLGLSARDRITTLRRTATVLAVMALLGGQVSLRVSASSRPSGAAFPALPPPPLESADPVPLPAILAAAPPASGPLVTPAIAAAVFAAAWPLRSRAFATRDATTLRAIETGAVLEIDLATMRTGGTPDQPLDGKFPAEYRISTPRQTQWPLRFLAEAITTVAGESVRQMMVFVRESPAGAWKIALVNDVGGGGDEWDVPPLLLPMLDADGYNLVPETPWIDPRDVTARVAAHWKSFLETGTAPAGGLEFVPGLFWTTRLEGELANRQDQPDTSGLVRHRTYHLDPSPADQTWSFGVTGSEIGIDVPVRLVCAPMTQTDQWLGPITQPEDRRKWGPDLAPGTHLSVTAEQIRMPCFYIPMTEGPIGLTGADKSEVALHGDSG